MVRSALLGLFLTVPVAASAQTLSGVVVRADSRDPVAGAQVEVRMRSTQPLATTTDSVGRFLVRGLPAGRYQLSVTHISHEPLLTDTMEISAGESVSLELRLGTSALRLPPVVVTTHNSPQLEGFYERMRARTGGHFLTRQDIESRGVTRTTDLLGMVPGVNVIPVRRRGSSRANLIALRASATGCEPAIFIDGSPSRQTVESTLDDLLVPDMIEAVEVYGSGAGAPNQYMTFGKCGLVLIWTRSHQTEGTRPLNWKRAIIGIGGLVAIILLAR